MDVAFNSLNNEELSKSIMEDKFYVLFLQAQTQLIYKTSSGPKR